MKSSLNGLTYNWLIDPLLAGAQKRIIEALDPGDRVVDIACGTGSLSMSMALVAKEVQGLDLAEDIIKFATERAQKKGIENVSFIAQDASDISLYKEMQFNVAVTSMSVHQFNAALAIQILKEMKRIAPKLILMDYNYLLPRSLPRIVINTIEGIAGGDHHKNFLIYKELGGLDHFLREAKLTVVTELFISSAFRVVMCI